MLNNIERLSITDKGDYLSHLDFEKLEHKFQAKALYNYNTFNENFLIIKAKKKEYKDLLFQIQLLLEDSIQMEYQVKMQSNYNNLIKEKEYELRLMDHSLECYRHSYTRLYTTNFLLSRKVEDEVKKDIQRQKQLDEYKNIKLNAIQIFQIKKAMLTRMTELNAMEEYNQKTEQKLTNNKVIQLKARVAFLIHQIEYSDKDLVMIKIKQDKIITKQRKQLKYNMKLYKEYTSVNKELLKTLFLFNSICNQIKVKNEETMLEKFNSIKINANKQLNTFEILNKYIRQNSIEYYQLCQEINQLSDKIQLKYKNESLLNDKIEELKDQLKNNFFYFQNHEDSMNKKKQVLISIMEYIIKSYNCLIKFNPKCYEIMPSVDSTTIDNMSYCLSSFCQFVVIFSKSISNTLKKAIESYFIYRLQQKHKKRFECIGYSDEKFISDYKEFIHKTTDQYYKMVSILNKSLKNHNENKDKVKEQKKEKIKPEQNIHNSNIFNHLLLSPPRNTFTKRNNLFKLTQQYDEKQMIDFKSSHIKTEEEDKITYPELTLDKENEDAYYYNQGTKKFHKSRKVFSYSFSSEQKIYLHRSTDISKLKLNYFHLKEKHPIKTQSIFELGYKIKKQFKTPKKSQLFLNKRNKTTEERFPILQNSSQKTQPKIIDIMYYNPNKDKALDKHKTTALFFHNNI